MEYVLIVVGQEFDLVVVFFIRDVVEEVVGWDLVIVFIEDGLVVDFEVEVRVWCFIREWVLDNFGFVKIDFFRFGIKFCVVGIQKSGFDSVKRLFFVFFWLLDFRVEDFEGGLGVVGCVYSF